MRSRAKEKMTMKYDAINKMKSWITICSPSFYPLIQIREKIAGVDRPKINTALSARYLKEQNV